MGRFLQAEKINQVKFKQTSGYFSEAARSDGEFRSHPYPFCLPQANVDENLYPEIRDAALAFFDKHAIKWHMGQDRHPSSHMCDSQICCVNFLFPFADKPAALADLLRPVFPDLQDMCKVEDEYYVSFEWVGRKNYLNELQLPNRPRSRGALFTSADAIVAFYRKDGSKQTVLIEWKYTESYPSNSLKFARGTGTDRTKIYQRLYDADDFPLKKDLLPDFDSLFYEPFYQLMRQQCLANEMEKAHENGADIVSLLHISPAHNQDFKRVTSPALRAFGDSPTTVWSKLVKQKDRFTEISAEELFGNPKIKGDPAIHDCIGYLNKRYMQQS